MYHKPAGTVFEVDDKWYVIVDQGKKLPNRAEKLYPQPTNLAEEYIHDDGTYHVCANLRCPNLVPKSKNRGAPRIYCSRRCGMLVVGRRQDAKRGGDQALLRDPLGRLYAVVLRRPRSVQKARAMFYEHLDGLIERCPEASEASNFHCPGRFNPNCYSLTTWSRYHQGGSWPGACLIYATLKDHYKLAYHADRARTPDRDYTLGRGEHWRWKEENAMLPVWEGIARP